MSKQTFRVCVVGAGDLGTQHAGGWQKCGAAELVAVADIDRARAENYAKKFSLPMCFSDYREAIEKSKPDIVSVCTPAYFHPEVTIFAAEHGAHVISEKPIALTLEAASRMIETTRRCKVKFSLGFQTRFWSGTEKLKELLSGGELGRPVMYRQSGAAEIRPKRAMHDALRGNGGAVIDFCCHTFDHWRYVFGSEPVRVTARGLTLAKDRPELAHLPQIAVDTAAILVDFASGDIGLISISWGLPPGTPWVSGDNDILGPKGRIIRGGDNLQILREGGKVEKVEGLKTDMHKELMSDFVDAIRRDRSPRIIGEDGRIGLKMSLAALESIQTKQPVAL